LGEGRVCVCRGETRRGPAVFIKNKIKIKNLSTLHPPRKTCHHPPTHPQRHPSRPTNRPTHQPTHPNPTHLVAVRRQLALHPVEEEGVAGPLGAEAVALLLPLPELCLQAVDLLGLEVVAVLRHVQLLLGLGGGGGEKGVGGVYMKATAW
jgi:hypothetical protein